MMIVTGSRAKTLNQTRNLYLACLFIIFGLTACSDSAPTITPPATVQQTSLQGEVLAPQSTQVEPDQLAEPSLKPVVATEDLLEPSELGIGQASTELDQSILKSLSKFAQTQDLIIEANSVRELEQLSEADRQVLQTIAAQQTMTAAEQLAAQQVDEATNKSRN